MTGASIVSGAFTSMKLETFPESGRVVALQQLKTAIEGQDLRTVGRILQSKALSTYDIDAHELLHTACEVGNLSIVRSLLDFGVYIDQPAQEGNDTPLHRACAVGHDWIVQELIQRGALLDLESSVGFSTALEYAADQDHVHCCELLLEAGACVCGFQKVCCQGKFKLVELFLKHGANPQQFVGTTPLFDAVCFPEILTLLRKYGADPLARNAEDIPGEGGDQPIHKAIRLGLVDSAKVLLDGGADPLAKDGHGVIALDLAKSLIFAHSVTEQQFPVHDRPVMIPVERMKQVVVLLERRVAEAALS